MTNDFTGYILAGGKSSRMGTDKAFLKIGEKTFLENAVEILKPNCKQTKIVLNKSQNHLIEKLPDGVSYIFDRFENRGAVGGIHAAFTDCKTEYAVILAVDLPFVTSEAIKKLCEIILQEKDFSAIVPRQKDQRLQPLCAVYRVKDCLFNLEKIFSEDVSISAHDFLKTTETKIIETGDLGAIKNLFTNVNSPSDFENLKRQNQ
ncbi:MAG: molybdenum cofactor guanylyltransferase [Pyrinomonadaceae bacterium]